MSALDRLRNPDPLTTAELLSLDTRVAWTVYRLLKAGGTSLWIAPPKAGKSTLMRSVALDKAAGRRVLGREATAGNVLVVSMEDEPDDVTEHLRETGDAGEGIFWAFREQVPSDVSRRPEWLSENMRKLEIDLAVVDTLMKFLRLDPQADDSSRYEEMLKYMEQLENVTRSTARHVAAVHHSNKSDPTSALGSQALKAAVNCYAFIERDTEGQRFLTTEQRGGDPFHRVELVQDGGLIRAGASMTKKAASEIEQAAARALSAEPQSVETIAKLIRKAKKPTGVALRALLKDGLAVHVTGPNGGYCLSPEATR